MIERIINEIEVWEDRFYKKLAELLNEHKLFTEDINIDFIPEFHNFYYIFLTFCQLVFFVYYSLDATPI